MSTCIRSALLAICFVPAGWAALFYPGVSSNPPPWPGGLIPFQFDPGVTAAQQVPYLDGLREWELAAHVQLVPRTSEAEYLLLRYDPFAPINSVTGSMPQVMTLKTLTRRQVAHEMAHVLGLEHEHVRPDRETYVMVLTNNIIPGNEQYFAVCTNCSAFGDYDFLSVVHFSGNFDSIDPANLNTIQVRPPNESFQPKLAGTVLSAGDRAAAAHLYGPPAGVTPLVTTTLDGGTGSLRAAMYYAESHDGATVAFNISTNDSGYSNGVWSIHLSGQLPTLVATGTVIDATTQPGYSNHPVVELTGNGLIPEAGEFVPGLTIFGEQCIIRGLAINDFSDLGIDLVFPECRSNVIEGCFIGTDALGFLPRPNGFHGIGCLQGARQNVIGGMASGARNIISGNARYGVLLVDSNGFENQVLGNYIGTDAAGTGAVANGLSGVGIFGHSKDNIIGAAGSGSGNLISGNTEYGVLIVETDTVGNVVLGNWIGLDASGQAALPNQLGGVAIFGEAANNVIGDTITNSRNVISGNTGYGVLIGGANTSNNVIQGNYIGTDPAGTAAVANTLSGVGIFSGTTGNEIGGVDAGAGNLLSGNGNYGILVADVGTRRNIIRGNYISTDRSGSRAMRNFLGGVLVSGGAEANTFAQNLVSGNSGAGFFVSGALTRSNRIEGNHIGTDASGSNALPNAFSAIFMNGGAHRNTIGLDVNGVGAGNRIAFNTADAIRLDDTNTLGNTIRGNEIFSNVFLGIELAAPSSFGVTTNDVDDADAGPNNLQNYPVLTNTVVWGHATTLQGTLQSSSGVFIVDFYRNHTGGPFGVGQGQFYLGSLVVTTDPGGLASFSYGVAGAFTGASFSATATDMASGDSSEFGASSLATTTSNGPAMPEMTGFQVTNGQYAAIVATWDIGWSHHLQVSSNLETWADAAAFISSAAPVELTNSISVDAIKRFFRLVSP